MRNIKEVIINGVNLEEILEKHEKWLKHEEDGEKADLSGVDLSYVDLRGRNLRSVNLRGANLRGGILRSVNLRSVDLSYANLSYADLSYADLIDTDLFHVDLSCTNLSNANLNRADLSATNFNNANLKYANLKDIKYNECTSFFALQCPEEGSFIGYKKTSYKIVKLLITEDAKRSSATTRKCRCSKAKVLSITNIENTEEYNEVVSFYDKSFVYRVGEIVEVKDFDENRWNECSTGIHFFLTREEAVKYQI